MLEQRKSCLSVRDSSLALRIFSREPLNDFRMGIQSLKSEKVVELIPKHQNPPIKQVFASS